MLDINEKKKVKSDFPEQKKKKKKLSFEPDSNQRPKDDMLTTTVLRSTNWAIEGITQW